MKNFGLLTLILLFTTLSLNAQTTLSAGDIAIVGINTDNPDDFAFVLLKDITVNTVINFTDNGWLAEGGFRNGEGVLTYTAPSNLAAGTVIIYSVSVANFTSSGSFALSTTGDQIIAFQGLESSPTLIYAINNAGAGVWQSDATSSNTSALPTGLTNGISAVALTEIDNAYYNGEANSDLSALRLAISNNTNWTGSNTTTYDFSIVITNPLPVELTTFSASTVGNTIKLNWQTATEVNNYGFEIERNTPLNPLSRGEVDGLGVWEKIGFVNGNGNSNSAKSYSLVDNKVSAGKYSFRLKQIDNDGQFEFSKIIEIDLESPNKFELSQNFPNPFNPNTTIKFNLPQSGNVKLALYNLLGQEVQTLVNGFKEAGVHSVNFNAKNLNSGIYLYKLEANGLTSVRKMTLLK